MKLTRTSKGRSIKIDSSTILQKILFVQELSPVQGITTNRRQGTNRNRKLDDLLPKNKKQVDTYIKSLPKVKTLFQLEMNQFQAGNVKKKLSNRQRITKNNELLEKN